MREGIVRSRSKENIGNTRLICTSKPYAQKTQAAFVAAQSINRHSTLHRTQRVWRAIIVLRSIIAVLYLIRIRHLPLLNMWLQTLVEVPHSRDRRDYRHDQ